MEIVWRREFIAEENPRAAARVRAAISAAIDSLRDHPNLGLAGTRELILANLPYIVVYRVAADTVRILAIIHTARQWPRRFYASRQPCFPHCAPRHWPDRSFRCFCSTNTASLPISDAERGRW